MLSSDRFIALWMIQLLIKHSTTSTNILEKRKHGQLLQGSRGQATKRAKSHHPSQVDQENRRPCFLCRFVLDHEISCKDRGASTLSITTYLGYQMDRPSDQH